MSRLLAPGFSSFRAPRFSKSSSVAAAVQIPLPDVTQEAAFKKTHESQTFIQPSQESFGTRPPRSTAVKPSSKESNQVNPSHGPGPYDRSKPVTSHVPYVGKKRTTGALKAPVSRATNGLKSPESHRNREKPKVLKEASTTSKQNMGNSDSVSKPVKRQLILDDTSIQSKLVRPKGLIGRPNSVAGGLIPPTTTGLNKKSHLPMASSRGISRSLQSLPQGIKPRGFGTSKQKSNSSDELSTSKVPNSAKPKLATIPSGRCSGLSRFGKPSGIRPRTSSYKTNMEAPPINMSTPSHIKKTESIKLDKLIISPIDDNSLLEKSGKNKWPIAVIETRPSDESSSLDVLPIENASKLPNSITTPPESFNATYNKSICTKVANYSQSNLNTTKPLENLNTTTVFSSAPTRSNVNNNNCNSTKDLNQTQVISKSQVVDRTDGQSANGLGRTTCEIPNMVNNSTGFFTQTRVIHQNTNTDAVIPTANLNATRVIHNQKNATEIIEDNEVFTDSNDFLWNVQMPSFEETPLKRAEKTSESVDTNYSFTEDILKVIAAISSNINTQPEPSVVMTTSPMKQAGPVTKHVLHHEVINTIITNTPAPDSTTATTSNSLLGNAQSDTSQHTCLDGEKSLELHLTRDKQHKTKTMLDDDSPKTPDKNDMESDDTIFDIGTRAYTVSAADLRRSKVIRRNTFQAYDASKFRAPKEMNLLETLEGNILMDNTSFLQFSNDTRSIKTMLLKLKRTLLEADCPSPLVKAPLKRSNSCAVRKLSDSTLYVPPLSPRNNNLSPMAVVDPLVPCSSSEGNEESEKEMYNEKGGASTTLSEKFKESLRRIEELEKETECHRYTIKLLQTQLETTSQKEEEMLEENILLREEVHHLNGKMQKLLVNPGTRERNSSSGSYKEEFDLCDSTSRKGILQRMYSNELNQE